MNNEAPKLPDVLLEMEHNRAQRAGAAMRSLCAELERAQTERDKLRDAVERALQDLRNDCPNAARDALANALEESTWP